MEIFNSLNNLNKDLSLALGFFDGVHLAHKAVIKNAVDFAKKNEKKSAVITFINHPCCYLWKDVIPQYIISRQQKEKMIADLEIDYLYYLDFKSISHLSPEKYLSEILKQNFAPCAITTGFNHFFGTNKSGNSNFLRKMQDKYNYKYFEIVAMEMEGEVISSTVIRNALADGNVEFANKLLGYNFFVKSKVIKGKGVGKKLGFPTLNLLWQEDIIKLKYGVYSVFVKINDKKFKGIANFGLKPTFGNMETPILEIHILDFDENIYGENVEVEFLKNIRDEKKFSSVDELKNQIKQDILSI